MSCITGDVQHMWSQHNILHQFHCPNQTHTKIWQSKIQCGNRRFRTRLPIEFYIYISPTDQKIVPRHSAKPEPIVPEKSFRGIPLLYVPGCHEENRARCTNHECGNLMASSLFECFYTHKHDCARCVIWRKHSMQGDFHASTQFQFASFGENQRNVPHTRGLKTSTRSQYQIVHHPISYSYNDADI